MLGLCLKNTDLLLKTKYYEQVQGTAMGSPISPVMANLFTEDFEVRPSTPSTPRPWRMYVDDTFIILKILRHGFLEHISSHDPHIQFNTEETRPDGSMPFLDSLVTHQQDRALFTTVYMEPAHTDQYMPWDNHTTILLTKVQLILQDTEWEHVFSIPQLLQKEEEHIMGLLQRHNYSSWALNRLRIKTTKTQQQQPW